MGYLKITLQSDLCCASGEAFGSSIDSDVCMDEYGIPYLPAKRLKGCLRQRAEEILPVEIINEIFGTAKNEGCGVAIGNAYIEDYDVIVEAIKAEHVHKNMITQLFTSVRSQTKMEEGIADEGSLRSVRVMNEKSPITGESVVLIANVQLQKNQEDLKNVCKALRHIGLNRNRGLGVIRCTYDETSPDKPLERKQEFIKRLQQKKITGIHYSVFFETPITLIGADGENEEYIEARAVIGCLAKEWLSKGKPVDDTFKRLFLSGDVIFSGLYPSYENRPCYPVPAFLQKAKETKLLFNSLIENHSPEKVTPKSIGGFAFQKENRYKIVKPKSDICYHNSITNKTLYMQESLGARQIYSGEIRMPQDCADIIVALLCNANLRFGRSKTAQYASCKLCFLEEKKDDYEENKIELKEGDFLYVVLNENLLIYNDNGVNTINLQEVKEQIAKDLNMADAVDATYNDEDVCEYKMVGGYHTLWQLQKPMVKVIKGGSVYCFKIIKNREVPMHALVGENNKEGFGSIRLFSKEQLVKINLVEKAPLQQRENQQEPRKPSDFESIRYALQSSVKQEQLMETVYQYVKNLTEITFSASLVGRVTLMLKESRGIYSDFQHRIASIKKEGMVERGKLLEEWIRGMLIAVYKEPERRSEDQAEEKFQQLTQDNGLWFSATELFLTLVKYRLRMGGKEDDEMLL